MKKRIWWLTIVAITLILTACGSKLTPEEAIKRGNVVSDYGLTGNLDKMDSFYNEVQINEIRITRFTKEGDPIFLNLTRDEGKIHLKNDSNKDKSGGGVTKYTCEKLSLTKQEDLKIYTLINCQRTGKDEPTNMQNIEILSVPAAP